MKRNADSATRRELPRALIAILIVAVIAALAAAAMAWHNSTVDQPRSEPTATPAAPLLHQYEKGQLLQVTDQRNFAFCTGRYQKTATLECLPLVFVTSGDYLQVDGGAAYFQEGPDGPGWYWPLLGKQASYYVEKQYGWVTDAAPMRQVNEIGVRAKSIFKVGDSVRPAYQWVIRTTPDPDAPPVSMNKFGQKELATGDDLLIITDGPLRRPDGHDWVEISGDTVHPGWIPCELVKQ